MTTSRTISRESVQVASTLGMVAPGLRQIGQVWRLFILLALGLVAAVVLACALPLFTLVSTTASVRNALNNGLYDPTSAVQLNDQVASATELGQIAAVLRQGYQQQAGIFFSAPPALSLQIPFSPIWQNDQQIAGHRMELHGYDIAHIAAHLPLLQGRLPREEGETLEVALSTSNAQHLQAHPGSTYTVFVHNPDGGQPIPLRLVVVGIFQEVSSFDLFWHGDSFLSYYDPQMTTTYDHAIISNDALLHLYEHWQQANGGQPIHFVTHMNVYFPLMLAAVNSTNLDELDQRLRVLSPTLLTQLKAYHINDFQVTNTDLQTLMGAARDQTSIVQVPVLLLLALMLLLILFFTQIMTELLVTRQAAAVVLFRTRGATLPQVFLTFVTQGLLLGLLTLLVSPLVLALVIRFPMQLVLPAADRQALNVLPGTPWEMARQLGWYPYALVLVAVGAMCAAIWRTLGSSTLGRGATLASRPFWQRFYLDLALLVLGGLFAGVYNYLASTGIINAQLQILLSGPCELVAAVMLCLGGILLCLRGFPWLIRWGAKAAARRRGLLPMLPLVQLARAPRQSIRSALLLAVTIAFAFFALVFSATQEQRVPDLAHYRVGADFSGRMEQALLPTISVPDGQFVKTYVDTHQFVVRQTTSQASYQHIAGVLSASAGYNGQHYFLHMSGALNVVAIDPASFPGSVIWSQNEDPQNIQLISQLARARDLFNSERPNAQMPALPALIDFQTAQAMHLAPGQSFTLSEDGGKFQLVVIGELAHIPSLNDALAPGDGGDAGILVDYASFVYAYERFLPGSSFNLNPNAVWLHTRQDATSISTVRRTLADGALALNNVYDAPGLMQALELDPLALDLQFALLLGVSIALLLALIGYLTSLWLAVKTRLQSLAALRALGASPTQLLWLLGCEQGVIAAFAIVVGVGCGFVFTSLALPSLIFSGTAQTGVAGNAAVDLIYQLQFSPPLQVVIPGSLLLGLAALVALCLLALGLATYTAARPSLAQTLRVEEYVDEVPLFVASTHKTRERTARSRRTAGTATGRRRLSTGLSARALSPVRSVWGYLVLTGLGIVIPLVLVCVVPLFSQVAATSGMRDLLAQPSNQYASVSNDLSSAYDQYGPTFDPVAQINKVTGQLDTALRRDSQPFFHDPAVIKLLGSASASSQKQSAAPGLSFVGLSSSALAAHIHLIQGHIPRPAPVLQIGLTPGIAARLHLTLGEIVTPQMGYPFAMQLVALFQPLSGHDSFIPLMTGPTQGVSSVDVLVSSEGLLQLSASLPHTAQRTLSLSEVDWYYPINRDQLSIGQLDSMLSTFSLLAQNGVVSSYNLPIAALTQYQSSVQIAQVPVLTTSLLIIGIILLFLGFMADLLVEQEAGTIALLRSRGATRGQIFQAFLKRLLLLCAISALFGLLLVIPAVVGLAHLVLSSRDQGALNLVLDQPALSLVHLYPYMLGCLAVLLGALSLALYRAIGVNVLTLRRESSRVRKQPFWQRYYLDVAGILLALAAYASTWYVTRSGLLDAQVNVLIKSPLVAATTVCLVLACMLVFLRLFPWLLRLGTALAVRNSKRVEPMLALSQMSRAPRLHARVVLLLLIATNFVVFISIFSTSQSQHINDVANYWSMADISGPLAFPAAQGQSAQLLQRYSQLAGVSAAAVGSVTELDYQPGSASVRIIAVDPAAFFQAVHWPETMTISQQQSLIQQLTSQRTQFARLAAETDTTQLGNDLGKRNVLPTVIDAALRDAYQLAPGRTFSLYERFPAFQDAWEVNALPASNASGQLIAATESRTITMLVDYQSLFDYQTAYARYAQTLRYHQNTGSPTFPVNYVWLKTDGSARDLATIRQAVSAGPLQITALSDRYSVLQQLNNDPLNRNLNGILLLGGLAPLALAWIGCLLACWINVRQRQVLFGVLRALGSTPGQLARVLLWEQVLIYGVAIALGSLLGLLTALMLLPSLILTSTIPSASTASALDLFTLQSTPPAHMVLAPSLALVIGALIFLGVLTLIFMYRATSRLVLAQTLRLNQD